MLQYLINRFSRIDFSNVISSTFLCLTFFTIGNVSAKQFYMEKTAVRNEIKSSAFVNLIKNNKKSNSLQGQKKTGKILFKKDDNTFSGKQVKSSRSEPESISLAGKWKFRLDPEKVGEKEEWFKTALPDNIKLPGSCQDQGYGEKVIQPWIGRLTPKFKYEGPASETDSGSERLLFTCFPEKVFSSFFKGIFPVFFCSCKEFTFLLFWIRLTRVELFKAFLTAVFSI